MYLQKDFGTLLSQKNQEESVPGQWVNDGWFREETVPSVQNEPS